MMQKRLLLLLTALLTIISCKKDKQSSPSILLSKITGSGGGTEAAFTYNGKQLTSAVINDAVWTVNCRCNINYTQTVTFNYDGQGKLTGTVIADTDPNYYGDVSSVITYSSDNISDIKFYRAGNLLDRDVALTYQNGNIAGYLITPYNNVFILAPQTIIFSYNGANQNITEQQTDPYGTQIITNSNFNSGPGLSSTVPFWVYFNTFFRNLISNIGSAEYLFGAPGANNPTDVAATSGVLAPEANMLSYQYNSNGYPSSIAPSIYQSPYTYEYISVP
jgi:hypothetical protein